MHLLSRNTVILKEESQCAILKAWSIPPKQDFDFPLEPLSEYEVENVVKKARAKSTAAGDGVSYKALKYCKKLQKYLSMLCEFWEEKNLVYNKCIV